MMSDRPGHEPGRMDADMARRIDEVCLRFEADWREGRQPRIDDYLAGVSPAGQPAPAPSWRPSHASSARRIPPRAPEAGPPTAPQPKTFPNPSMIAEAPTIAPRPPPNTAIQGEMPSVVHEEATVPPVDPPRFSPRSAHRSGAPARSIGHARRSPNPTASATSATTRSSARSPAAAWASSSRPGRSASTGPSRSR